MLKCAEYCHSLSGERTRSMQAFDCKARKSRTVKIAADRLGSPSPCVPQRGNMMSVVRQLWQGEEGQDIAEYAVMLAVILVIVVGTIRLIGSNANNVFSSVASSIAQ